MVSPGFSINSYCRFIIRPQIRKKGDVGDDEKTLLPQVFFFPLHHHHPDLYFKWIIRLGRTCILIGQATIVRLCINTGIQTDHQFRRAIWIVRRWRRIIQITCLNGWSVCLSLFIHRRIIRLTIAACPISMQVRSRRMIHL